MTAVIHWFRRDLRLADNTALLRAAATAERLIPVFVVDDAILKRPDTGASRVRFLLACLHALAADLAESGSRLIVLRGDPADELVRLARAVGATAVHWNKDYEPYARGRDTRVAEALAGAGIRAHAWKDQVLFEENEILTASRRPFTVFTPYARAWRTLKPPRPAGMPRLPAPSSDVHLATVPLPAAADLGFTSDATLPKPGEAAARARLRDFVATGLDDYDARRNFPGEVGTSGLSPYLRLGVLSVRTVHAAAVGKSRGAQTFTTELIWRDFYQQLLFHHPNVEREAFKPAMRALAWENDRALFAAWRRGETGFPIVDAAMRQLRATGWMHNRCRMIVASFLTKDLLIDWRWGERHFMRELVDGDLAANNGGWQWAASTGTDAQPWFRIFNPTSQGETFDPDGSYVRRWIPELTNVPNRWIHQPWALPPTEAAKAGLVLGETYARRVVLHEERRRRALAMYEATRASG
jgi:deoxyribodipyrimidine photo-lyase